MGEGTSWMSYKNWSSLYFRLEGSLEDAPMKYNVYRDGKIIAADIEDTSFIDYDFDPTEPHTWSVSISCRNGGESHWNRLEKEFCKEDEPDVHIWNTLSESLKIHPNPASNTAYISGNDIVKTEVYNALGQMIDVKYGDIHFFDVSAFEPGLYLFKIYDSHSNAVTKRIIIAR